MIKTNYINEMKRNLLGCLETAIFMREARTRFGDTKDEAIRSFAIPLLLVPLTLFMLYIYPDTRLPDKDAGLIAALYCLRLFMVWAFFFSIVYWIVGEVDRKKHFYQFVIASNWLAVPATVVFLPVLWMGMTGTHSWAELYPFTMCLIFYTYAFTAYMASNVLRIPWELAGFIVFLSVCLNDTSLDLFYWVGGKL